MEHVEAFTKITILCIKNHQLQNVKEHRQGMMQSAHMQWLLTTPAVLIANLQRIAVAFKIDLSTFGCLLRVIV